MLIKQRKYATQTEKKVLIKAGKTLYSVIHIHIYVIK